MTVGNGVMGQFGDTTLTKVFVGGLAWETQKEALREHFDKYGEILEAVIISDKVTGRSKGYGFVTFKEPEEAKQACEDSTPVINGRRANCNLASLGARRPRSSSTPPPHQGPVGPVKNARPRSAIAAATPPPGSHVQWYYPRVAAPASPFHQHQHQHHQHHPAGPYYGYSPAYIATDVSYNHKLSYTGGSYMNGHSSQVYLGQPIMGAAALMPMYPLHHYQQYQTMGHPAHFYSQVAAGPMGTVPALMSKPISIAPNPACLATE